MLTVLLNINITVQECDATKLNRRENAGDGARWARDHGATIIDINMGCPVDKVTKKDGGSKLLCIPDTATQVVERVVTIHSTGPPPAPGEFKR